MSVRESGESESGCGCCRVVIRITMSGLKISSRAGMANSSLIRMGTRSFPAVLNAATNF